MALNLRPLPHGRGSFLPTVTTSPRAAAAARACVPPRMPFVEHDGGEVLDSLSVTSCDNLEGDSRTAATPPREAPLTDNARERLILEHDLQAVG